MPLARLAAVRAEGASRTAPLPAPPGNASLGLAVSALGLQVRLRASQAWWPPPPSSSRGRKADSGQGKRRSVPSQLLPHAWHCAATVASASPLSAPFTSTRLHRTLLQVWLSPYQVAHGLAAAEHVMETLPRPPPAFVPPPAAAVAAQVCQPSLPVFACMLQM